LEPTLSGNRFLGWYSNPSGGTKVEQMLKGTSGNMALYAKWEIIPIYTITFNSMFADTKPIPQTKSILEGNVIGALPTPPTLSGYVFAGWCTVIQGMSGVGDFVSESTKVTKNMVLYPKWEIRDADNNLYTQIKIGTQIWMVENLKTTKYSNGNQISTDAMKCPNGVENNASKYGILYNSLEGLPLILGWRVPTKEDFELLKNYLITNNFGYNGVDTAIAKALASQSDWIASPNTDVPGNNSTNNSKSGFNAMPAGNIYSGGLINDSIGYASTFWTNSTDGSTQGWPVYYRISYNSNNLMQCSAVRIGLWLSMRLIRDKLAD
ncbi:MAG: FISUMP domain-containing protein, partial [Fibrobacterota bacterium]